MEFKNESIDIGDVKAGTTKKSHFEYLGSPSDIRDITLSCGSCTKCNKEDIYEKDGITIIPFKYIDPHVSNAGSKGKYPDGSIEVQKNITIWFEDGSEKFVAKTNGVGTTRNPQTKKKVLSYKARVLL